jgi:hypothetical protein
LFKIILVSNIIMSGLSLPGVLAVTRNGLSDVSTVEIVDDVFAKEYSVARNAATDSLTYSYYIMVDYDINGQITHHSAGEDLNDDAWSMTGFSVTNSTADSNPRFSLPTAVGKTIPAGLIDAIDTDNQTDAPIGTFPVFLTLTLDSQGILSASATITGNSVTSTATGENVLRAQVVQWEVNGVTEPAVESDTSDVLTATLSASMLNENYADQLATLVSTYDGKSVLASWEITINSVPQAVDNSLSQHARNLGIVDNKVFAKDAKIVAATPYDYCISINDYQGTVINIADGNVHGVVNQTNLGASNQE